MYHSLKKQNRMRLSNGRTISTAPLASGRSEIAATEEAELKAISLAMRKRQPIYFVKHINGTTLDVLLYPDAALRLARAIQSRIANIGDPLVVKVFERIGSNQYRIA